MTANQKPVLFLAVGLVSSLVIFRPATVSAQSGDRTSVAQEQAESQGSEERGSEPDATPQDSPSRGFGGPDQVDNLIANDDETVSRIIETNLYEPWFEWKKGLQEKHGLAFSVDYSLAWLGGRSETALERGAHWPSAA